MKLVKILVLVGFLVVSAAAWAKPNIIFILTDDLGYGDVGYAWQEKRKVGEARIYTPNIDKLAREGVILSSHYCAAPVCAPSRASILTGKLQKRDNGCSVHDNMFDHPIREPETLGTMLKKGGYHTMAIGKWGVGGGGESGTPVMAHPLDKGFDHYYGFMDHMAGHTYYHYDGFIRGAYMGLWHDREKVTPEGVGIYSTDLFVARAKKDIEAVVTDHPGEPFFLYFAVNTVHGSGRCDDSLKNKHALHVPGRPYPQEGVTWPLQPEPLEARNTWIDPRYRDLPNENMRRYATAISRLDDAMADLMAHLEKLGVAENTILVFTSDNGPTDEYGTDTRFFNSTGPFDGMKRDVYEGGLRVPTFVWTKGGFPGGKKVDDMPSISTDWMATFADLAGVDCPEQCDGVSLLNRWRGRAIPEPSKITSAYVGHGSGQPDFKEFAARKGASLVRGDQEMYREGDIVHLRAGGKNKPWRKYNVVQDPHQDHDLNQETAAREVMVLDGVWGFQFGNEPYQQVTIPHSWNAYDAAEGAQGKKTDAKSVNSTVYKRGTATYTQTFAFQPKANQRYFVRGGGASIVSEVFVNGQSAGKHEGAFTAFCYEVTDLLKKGENTICVKVDNTHRDHIAPQRGDFSMFGGLYRPVELITTPSTCIDPLFYASPGVFITTQSLADDKAVVDVKVLVNAKDAIKGEVAVNICDAQGQVVATGTAKADKETVLTLTIPKPIRWDGVKNPYLYTAQVILKTDKGQTDQVRQTFGLRTIEIDPKKGFILNGRACQLRGVSRHQDKKGKGWALTPADEMRDIQLITEMGATALRTAHYPQSTHIYDLCDKAGLIVWSEVPNVNLVRGTADFRANNRQQALEMIYQHGNHPSICVWGIYNEIYHQPEPAMNACNMEKELIDLNAFVKATDPTRLTVAASNQPHRKKLNTIPDHIAFNTYPGWYGGGAETMATNLDNFIKNHPGKGVGVSEYGHGGSIHVHEDPPKRPKHVSPWHPEEYQSHAHEVNYRCIQARPEIWGAFVWNMFDFGSSARYEGDAAGINDKGLVTYDRETCKDAYYFYQANWSTKPMVYITSRRFTERKQAGVAVKVYSNAEAVTLTVNGKTVGTRRPDAQKRAIWEHVTLQPGANTIQATIQVNGKTYTDACVWRCLLP